MGLTSLIFPWISLLCLQSQTQLKSYGWHIYFTPICASALTFVFRQLSFYNSSRQSLINSRSSSLQDWVETFIFTHLSYLPSTRVLRGPRPNSPSCWNYAASLSETSRSIWLTDCLYSKRLRRPFTSVSWNMCLCVCNILKATETLSFSF